MAKLQLPLHDGGDRDALASVMADDHTTVNDNTLGGDLYLVDEPLFPASRKSV